MASRKGSPNRFPGRRFPLAQVFPGADWYLAEHRQAGTREHVLFATKDGAVIYAPDEPRWVGCSPWVATGRGWWVQELLARQAAARITRILKAEGRLA